MAREEITILTNMCMIYDGDKILVQDRLNPDWPGITFPGGHVEMNESFVGSTIREVFEETGLEVSNLQICGIKQWTYQKSYHRYIVFLYKTNKFKGKLKSSDEGKVFWIRRAELDKYTLADGFKEMLEVFENDDVCENYHWFEDNKWHCKNM